MAATKATPRERTVQIVLIGIEIVVTAVLFWVAWSVSDDGFSDPDDTGTLRIHEVDERPEGHDTQPRRARDADGAADAAVSYAAVSQRWLYFTDEQITDAVEEIAAPDAVDELAADTIAEVTAARTALGGSPGPVWWLVRPMAWRVESLRPDEAAVAVWTVTVLSAEEVAAPQAEWVTVTVDLEWIDGGWKLDALSDTPGPTPMPGPGDAPWDAIPFDDALEGFTRIDGDLAS